MKIFIADDDNIIRAGIRKIINRYLPEHTVAGEAVDGQEALEAIEADRPDILITDVKMPVLDGIELIRELKYRDIPVKIIVLSGFEEYSLVRESLKNGAADYLLKPVDSKVLVELVKKLEQDIENDKKAEEEARFVSHAVNQTLESMKGQLLKELIKGNAEAAVSFAGTSRELDFCGERFYCLLLLSSDYSAPLALAGIKRPDIMPARGFFEKYRTDHKGLTRMLTTQLDPQLAILFAAQTGTENDFLSTVLEAAGKLSDYCREELDLLASCGVSGVFPELSQTPDAFMKAKLALGRRFAEGSGRIYRYIRSEGPFSLIEEGRLAQAEEELVKGLELGQLPRVRKAVESLLQHTAPARVHPEHFREVWGRIVDRVGKWARDFADHPDSFDSGWIQYSIQELDTQDGLKQYLQTVFTRSVERINLERSDKSKKSIELAKDYIRRHFTEELSLRLVSEQVSLNPTYFSDLFKNETGKNFIDFVIETRINAAKKLLSKPEAKIYEIAEAVGYHDPTTFNRAFKKCVGVSPIEYRKIIK